MVTPESKIKNLDDALEQIKVWRNVGKTIVFTNGCFDLLHPGHVDYLFKAAALGNKLVVGINSDKSVSGLKGHHRPIQSETARMIIMAALACTDLVVLFSDDTPYNLIKAIKPDVLVKGGDYKVQDIVGYDIVTTNGGKVVTLDFLPGYSTTALEEKIKSIH